VLENAVGNTVATVCTQRQQNLFTYSFTQLSKRNSNKYKCEYKQRQKKPLFKTEDLRHGSAVDDTPDGEMLLYWVEMGILHINPNITQIWR
jgi:hypothetical protein